MSKSNRDGVLLRCRDLSKSFTVGGKTNRVLRNIDLCVGSGEITVIHGRSGAGKSTLIDLLGGLSRPDSGSILFRNRYIEHSPDEEISLLRRTRIGIIFQKPNLIPSWTAFENIEVPLMHTDMPKPERRKKVAMLLELIDCGDKSDHLPSQLSAGQQQRVAIARALVHDPLLLLADEPTEDLDFETAGEIINTLLTPLKTQGVSVLVTTHGNFPLDIADRIFELRDGEISPDNKR